MEHMGSYCILYMGISGDFVHRPTSKNPLDSGDDLVVGSLEFTWPWFHG